MNGGLIPLRWYFWGFAFGGLFLWSIFTGHLRWHKSSYVCNGKYVYSAPTQWYTKMKLGSVEWRSNNSVYDCPSINQVPVTKDQPATSLETGPIAPGTIPSN